MKRKSEDTVVDISTPNKNPKKDTNKNAKQIEKLNNKLAAIKGDKKQNVVKKPVTISKKSGEIENKPAVKKGTGEGDIDITQSLTDTGISKTKRMRFEKSGGKKSGKFKKAEAPKTKPNWNEFKKKKKELQKKRKMTNSHYDIIVESKKIWEQMRRADCPDEKKKQLIKNLHKLVKDKMASVVFVHDMSRIIQWLLKLSPVEQRKEVEKELLPQAVAMMKSKYSSVIVKKMLKYGDQSSKTEIIQLLIPHVSTLLSHSVASPILMYAYDQVATPEQKNQMRQQLYGGLYKSSDGDKINSLEDIFKHSPDMKTAILNVTKKIVTKSLQKVQVTGSALLHTVLLDYINHSNDTDLTEVLEMMATLPILQFIYTKPGSQVAMHIIWNATNKLKKKIIKELKGHVKDIAISEFGHLALVTLFDNVDDTVLLKKAILSEVLTDVETIVQNEYGRKVIAHLVSWCDSTFFHPSCVETIKQGDDFATRKKDREVRNKEILESVSEALLNCISKNADFWLSTSSVAMVTSVILKHALGPGLKEALDSVANIIVDVDKQVELELKKNDKSKEASTSLTPFIEHPGFHLVLKKLIQNDKTNLEKKIVLNEKNKEKKIPNEDQDETREENVEENPVKDNSAATKFPTLSESIVKKLSTEVLDKWTECNRACFILVFILETEIEDCIKELKSKLSKYKNKLKTQKFTGAKVLLGKLD